MEEIFPCVPLHHALDAQAALVARQRGAGPRGAARGAAPARLHLGGTSVP